MTRKTTTPAGCDPARGCHCVKPCLVCSCLSTTNAPTKQPRPGTALVSFLQRYRAELNAWREHHGDRHSQGLIECCTALLDEAEGGRHDG